MSVLIHHQSRDSALLTSICMQHLRVLLSWCVKAFAITATELEEGLNTRLFNKMRRSLSFPTGFLHALSCCQSPRVVSGPGSPWADRFPKSPPFPVSTVSGTANTSCSSWRRRKPRSEQSLASCVWVFSSRTSSVSQVTSVFSRKMGLIPFTCLLQSWLGCLIHVSGLAGDCGMNDAI